MIPLKDSMITKTVKQPDIIITGDINNIKIETTKAVLYTLPNEYTVWIAKTRCFKATNSLTEITFKFNIKDNIVITTSKNNQTDKVEVIDCYKLKKLIEEE